MFSKHREAARAAVLHSTYAYGTESSSHGAVSSRVIALIRGLLPVGGGCVAEEHAAAEGANPVNAAQLSGLEGAGSGIDVGGNGTITTGANETQPIQPSSRTDDGRILQTCSSGRRRCKAACGRRSPAAGRHASVRPPRQFSGRLDASTTFSRRFCVITSLAKNQASPTIHGRRRGAIAPATFSNYFPGCMDQSYA